MLKTLFKSLNARETELSDELGNGKDEYQILSILFRHCIQYTGATMPSRKFVTAFQKLGRSKTKKAINSSLPIIIAADKVTLSSAGRLLKFSSGPIIFPNPGPTTEIEVTAADILVIKS